MVNKEVFISRTEKISQHLQKLTKYRNISLKDYINSEVIQDIAEYNIFQIVNHIIDIVEHIVVDEDYGLPESAYDAVQILIDKKRVTEKTGELLRKMIGLRNIIAHEYINMNKEVIYDVLVNGLVSIKRIVSQLIRRYI